MRRLFLAPCLTILLIPAQVNAAEPILELRDGDRVVLLGATMIEREQRYGYWETALTAAYPDRNVIFRNLGWSGDTVWGESRGLFDPPETGYERLVELTRELKPTLIILGYGCNEAFAGPEGLEPFLAQYKRLLDDLSTTEARFAFLTPLTMESLGPPWPDPTEYNAHAALYGAAIAKLAAEHDAPVIRLTMPSRDAGAPTDNGQHLNAYGYWQTADQLRRELPADSREFDWDELNPLQTSNDAAALEQLRSAIIAKNQLFFYRWRPQNFTYLFGFRKHEQGQNAVEVAQFDPFIAEAEQRIRDILQQLTVE